MEFRQITKDIERYAFIGGWEESFKRTFERKDYNWIFDNRNQVYGVFDGNSFAGGYCLLNSHAVLDGRIVKSGLCNNVFVVPNYQGFHLFTKLGRFALKKAEEQGVSILIGMPNESSVPGHRRVGWTLFEKNFFFEKQITNRPALTYDIEKNIKHLTLDNFLEYKEALQKFVLKISIERTFSILKEASYLHWRYFERPSVDYKIYVYQTGERIAGYVVYKFFEPLNRLHILDIEAENEDIFRKLIHISYTFQESYHVINVLGSTIYLNYFINAGFTQSMEYSQLIAYQPGVKQPISMGDTSNIVVGDNEVF